MSERWLRLNVGWDESEWVIMLEPLSQLAWIKLLCFTKDRGSKGAVKAMTHMAAAKKWGIPVRAVSDMISGAKRDGALIEGKDGRWVIANWKQYQEPDLTAADRKRKQREKAALNGHGGHAVTSRDQA